jgi:predicted nicotinamide N-methyase
MISLTLALLGCRKVIATDLPEIMENTVENINNNIHRSNKINAIQTTSLSWGDKEDFKKIQNEKIDLLICCELLYKEAPWEKLLDTILFIAKLNTNLELIFAYKKRYISQELFLQEFKKYFSIEEVPKEKFHIEFQTNLDDYHLLICKFTDC